ncbi:MAG: hypothetical protein JNK82_25715 [Myxococcaceae bacterium]|nr:hypothetical protein [Myxococcaceae bacterium]
MKLLATVVVVVMSSCLLEPVLVPDVGAQKVGEKIAFGEAAAVRVWVNGDAWKADPLDLRQVLTPVHVNIENGSTRPLRLAYADFTLVGDSGMRYAAMSPLRADSMLPRSSADGAAPELQLVAAHRASPVRVAPRFRHRHFYIAPQYGYYYPGYPLWGAPFPYTYFGGGPYSWPRTLPSDDMLAEALPEGVLEPGGQVDGFVYFQGVTQREARVRFDYQLHDARADAKLGEVIIPMRVKAP